MNDSAGGAIFGKYIKVRQNRRRGATDYKFGKILKPGTKVFLCNKGCGRTMREVFDGIEERGYKSEKINGRLYVIGWVRGFDRYDNRYTVAYKPDQVYGGDFYMPFDLKTEDDFNLLEDDLFEL